MGSFLSFFPRYKDILLSMTGSVLEKVQFHYNTVELSDIDDDTIDEVRMTHGWVWFSSNLLLIAE